MQWSFLHLKQITETKVNNIGGETTAENAKKMKNTKNKTKSKVWYCPLAIQCEWSWREWSPKCNSENARVSALFPPEGGDLFRKQPMTGCKFASKARLSEHALVNLSLFRHCRSLPHCLERNSFSHDVRITESVVKMKASLCFLTEWKKVALLWTEKGGIIKKQILHN